MGGSMRRKTIIIIIAVLSLVIILMMLERGNYNLIPAMNGTYQSERVNGYYVLISIQKDDSSFIKYIDSREVDRGTYEQIENNRYER